MVASLYESLLQELGEQLHIPLRPDRESCVIEYKDGLRVQLELDRQEEFLRIVSDFGEIAPGRYRENLFREALKSNGLPPPHVGVFALSHNSTHLILFDVLPVRNLTGLHIADFLTPFLEKAKVWREAITTGQLPSVSSGRSSRSGIFGLM